MYCLNPTKNVRDCSYEGLTCVENNVKDITPFEYFYSSALGNRLVICSGNLLSWYIIAGGFFTFLLLSGNSRRKILASALSVALSKLRENATVTSFFVVTTQYFSSLL